MIGAIVAIFVVFGIFTVVASLFGLYVWRVDPNTVAVWRGVLRARREARHGPAA
jgi:type IV secretory pathway TrbD component